MEENNNLEPSKTVIEKLREIFFRRHTEKLSKGLYDDRDVEKVRSDDHYVGQFIRPRESMEEVSDRMNESLIFRMEFGVNDMTEDSFDRWAWEKGAVFFHNCDKDGHKILFIKTKEYRKDMNILPMVKRFFAYALERVYRKNVDEQVVILFDMSEAGLANLDMDLIRFIMTSFKIYYPKILAYMLIFEMPWIFNAAWKIIKTWMSPEAVQRIKFVYKNNIQEYIDKDQLLEHMGGTDKYVYKYVPENERLDDDLNKDVSPTSGMKKVTFAESTAYHSFSDDSVKNDQSHHSHKKSKQRKSSENSLDDNSFIGRLLTISPAEELEFHLGERDKEKCGIITLKNTLPYCIAYKVKTTSPEKYRVRPCSGLVQAGSKVEVCVTLQQAFQNTSKDKFLVMAVEVTDDVVDNTAELWKTVRKESIMEHRIRCAQSGRDPVINKDFNQSMEPEHMKILMQKLNDLEKTSHGQQRRLNILVVLQIVMVVLMLGMFVYTQQHNGEHDTSASLGSKISL